MVDTSAIGETTKILSTYISTHKLEVILLIFGVYILIYIKEYRNEVKAFIEKF